MDEAKYVISAEKLQEVMAEHLAQSLDISYMEALPYITDSVLKKIVDGLDELLGMEIDTAIEEIGREISSDS